MLHEMDDEGGRLDILYVVPLPFFEDFTALDFVLADEPKLEQIIVIIINLASSRAGGIHQIFDALTQLLIVNVRSFT